MALAPKQSQNTRVPFSNTENKFQVFSGKKL
jgi:hypothetical protein